MVISSREVPGPFFCHALAAGSQGCLLQCNIVNPAAALRDRDQSTVTGRFTPGGAEGEISVHGEAAAGASGCGAALPPPAGGRPARRPLREGPAWKVRGAPLTPEWETAGPR